MRIAIVYDRINKIGGAEKVLESLHRIWPDAPIYTSVFSPRKAKWASGMRVVTSFLQKFPFARNHHEWFFWAMPFAFESFDFSDYDIVISVSSAESKGVITRPSTLHIHYCLTPTKYLHSQTKLHLHHSPLGKIGQSVLKILWKHQRKWDLIAAQRPDVQVSISKTIDERSKLYYNRVSDEVIYPPVDCEKFKKNESENPEKESFFLLVSRLVPSKRIDIAIKAFNALGEKLVIIGDGTMKRALKKISKKNIIFTGQVEQEKLQAYYQHCKAFIFPSEEDFGIAMVEALSAGKPVIAYKKGGASEIIDHGKHGLLFDAQKVSSIMKSVHDLDKYTFNSLVLMKRAQRFDKKKFESEFEQFVRKQWRIHQSKM